MTRASATSPADTGNGSSTGAIHHALPHTLDISKVHALHDALSELPHAHDIMLGCAEVERLTSPCVQLLLAYARLIESQGHHVQFHQASDAVKAAFHDTGLNDELVRRSS